MRGMGLVEFLLARIAEDEAVAKAASERNGATWATEDLMDGARITGATEFGNPRSYRGDSMLWDDEGAMGMFAETAAHVVRHNPARVLAECEAKRMLVNIYLEVVRRRDAMPRQLERSFATQSVDDFEVSLRVLATVYANHPDYDAEWKA